MEGLIDRKKLRDLYYARAKELGESSDDPTFTLRAKIKVVNNLLKEVNTGGFRFLIDELEMLGGTREGPMPLQFFLAGIGSCLLTQVTRFSAVKDIEITSLELDIRGRMPLKEKYELGDRTSHFDEIWYTLFFESPAKSEEIIDLVHRAEKSCTATQSLKFPVNVNYKVLLNRKEIE